ncbi:hypothetical protein [Methylomonas rapida]|jgi:hypothetical protein|uniref:Uncharacterized protein n=1 Tax=Methylomonas rapida TaxID=2963939 RepID=A0ABY7GHS7_9GAMM|nr:hypothetical protein [Methylomonas rapida]WAR43784.1 hypothetical protein NM686_015560 [Methylomonas rapida]
MKKTYPDLPEWEFELDEVSANVYEVVGTDKLGHKVSSKGVDLDELIEICRKDAKAIEADSCGIDD